MHHAPALEGLARCYADACILAVMSARQSIMHMLIFQALDKTRYGKGVMGDTLGLDGRPEIAIRDVVHRFARDAILITEETDDDTARGWPVDSSLPVVFVCDPTDRSKFFAKFLESLKASGHGERHTGEVLYQTDREALWEEVFRNSPSRETPLSIVGPLSAITCIRNGRPFFAAMVSYLTDQITIAGPTGVYTLNLPDYRNKSAVDAVNFELITNHGQRLHFQTAAQACPSQDDHLRFATYLGKSGYAENFDATAIFVGQHPKDYLHHSEPGGPSRVLYLSDLQRGHGPIGFVMSNGEKIGEFVHWLPFVIYGTTQDGQRALSLYEVSIDRPWTKDGILMSTSEPYSLFRMRPDQTGHYLDVRRLRKFSHPSHFRSTLVVTHADNGPLREVMGLQEYREIVLI